MFFMVQFVHPARQDITLAGVLTLPVAMADGSPFPARDLAILLALAGFRMVAHP